MTSNAHPERQASSYRPSSSGRIDSDASPVAMRGTPRRPACASRGADPFETVV